MINIYIEYCLRRHNQEVPVNLKVYYSRLHAGSALQNILYVARQSPEYRIAHRIHDFFSLV